MRRAYLADVLVLIKVRIAVWVVFTVVAGFILGAAPDTQSLLLPLIIGTALVVAGTNALNQVAEVHVDGLMRRTRNRPLPTGRMAVGPVAVAAGLAGATGIAFLAVTVNGLTAALAALTLVSYVFLYTPLKRRSTLATLVGAVPGALPIAGGWAAARGQIDATALVLFMIMFLWQMPHFLALSWLYREDYANAGIRMLTGLDSTGRLTFAHATAYAVALIPVALLPALMGVTGRAYFWGALILSIAYGWAALMAAINPDTARARRLFLWSISYLPVLLTLMMVDTGS
jgi:protoheme IX farnesyltransferase